jgi:hypothetical protein
MATTDKIIDACLLAIGEDLTNPVEYSRADVLVLINHLYQHDIGRRLRTLGSYVYDASDTAHTIAAGVGTLPADFLLPAQVYDGDAPGDRPIKQIFDIADKVEDGAATSQYMLVSQTEFWIFGKNPAKTIKMYYYVKPAALADSASSSPAALTETYHIGPKGIFEAAIKAEYAKRQNNTYDMLDMLALIEDLLNEIETAHSSGKKDDSLDTIKMVW